MKDVVYLVTRKVIITDGDFDDYSHSVKGIYNSLEDARKDVEETAVSGYLLSELPDDWKWNWNGMRYYSVKGVDWCEKHCRTEYEIIQTDIL